MNNSRTKNTARNVTFGSLNQVITLLLSFINRTIFIKVLGAEYLGINGLFSDILMMLSLADLGFGTAMAYSFYKPLAANNRNKVTALVNFYKKVYRIIAFSIAIIGLALVPFIKYIVNTKETIPYIEVYYLFFLANTVVSYLLVYKSTLISADQKNYIISKYNMWISFGRTILQSILLIVTRNYMVYLLIQITSTLVNNIIISLIANKLYPHIKESGQKLTSSEKKNILENMKSIFIYKFSSVLLNGADNIIISVMVGTLWVGIYSNYNLVINAVNGFINILYSSTTASLGNIIITEKPKKRFEVFQSMQVISLIISCSVTVCFFVLINDLINIWLGKEYVLNYVILLAITVNFYLGNILHPIWTYREATGLYMKTKYIMVIAAVENIILSIILGKYFGMSGILFASAISRLTTYFWLEPSLLFKIYFKEKVSKYYVPLVLNIIITTILIIGLMTVSEYFIIDTWFKLVIKTLLIGLVILVVVFYVYQKTTGYRMLVNRVKDFVRK